MVSLHALLLLLLQQHETMLVVVMVTTITSASPICCQHIGNAEVMTVTVATTNIVKNVALSHVVGSTALHCFACGAGGTSCAVAAAAIRVLALPQLSQHEFPWM
jgi:hypothetical protein